MAPFFLTDPRETAASLLLKIDQQATLTEATGSRPQRLKGELHAALDQPVAGSESLPVKLHRFGLHSLDSPANAPTRDLGVLGLSGEGVLEPTSHGKFVWRLVMAPATRVSYQEIAVVGDLPAEPNFYIAPSEPFTCNIDILIEILADATTRSSARVKVLEGTILLSQQECETGSLHAIELALPQQPAYTFPASATPKLVVPLKPVSFPLANGSWTGMSWPKRLEAANKIWGKCCIDFEARGFKRVPNPKLAYCKEYPPILDSHKQEGVIEVFFVVSNLGGYTGAGGFPSAGIILQEPKPPGHGRYNENLLAHELGHVAAGCHPDGDLCPPGVWCGEAGTVLEVGDPNPTHNTLNNCLEAREYMPLAETQLDHCTMKPDQ